MSYALLQSFVQAMPKAELHVHIEGTLEPELMMVLAQKNHVKLSYTSLDAIRDAYNFDNLQSFLDLYYQGMAVLNTESDFYDLTWAYLSRAAADNVRHVEVFFDPQAHMERGISFETVLNGIHRALQDGQQQLGISFYLIMCFLRHLSPESAMQTLEWAIPHKAKIKAVGLDSSEKPFPPYLFDAVFDRAQAEGFLTVAHAGEEGSADYIWQALNLLNVKRIDHGVRCEDDAILLDVLKTKEIPLTVCPLSNVKLKVFPDLSVHNLKRLLDYGLCVTINSDDPAYFGGYMNQNFLETQAALGLSFKDLYILSLNSFKASFLPESTKRFYANELLTLLNTTLQHQDAGTVLAM